MKISAFFIILLLPSFFYSQNGNWQIYYSHNQVNCLAADGNDLWIGYDFGLERRNILTGETEMFYSGNSLLYHNYIRTIAIDPEGNKWIATGIWFRPEQMNGIMTGNLVKYDGHNWTEYTVSNSDIRNNEVNSLDFDKDGHAWIGTLWDLTEFDGVNWKHHYADFFLNSVLKVKVDSAGNKWLASGYISTHEGGAGLIKFRDSTWTLYNDSLALPRGTYIYAIEFDKQGFIWLGTDLGLVRFDPSAPARQNQWKLYTTENSDLPDNHVTSIAIDSSGARWIGTLSGGIVRFDSRGWKIFTPAVIGLPVHAVTSLVIDKYNTKWIGSAGKSLINYDGSNWRFYNTSNSGLNSNHIRNITADPEGIKWIITSEGSLYRFDGRNWLCENEGEYSLLHREKITAAAAAPDSSMWFAGTVHIFNYKGNSLTAFTSNDVGSEINRVRDIVFDYDKHAWFALTNGVAEYDGTLWRYFPKPQPLYVRADTIFSIAADSGGNIYAGVQSGIEKFDGHEWSRFAFSWGTQADGRVNKLCFDKMHMLWAPFGSWSGSFSHGGIYYFYNNQQQAVDGSLIKAFDPWFWTVELGADDTKWFGSQWYGMHKLKPNAPPEDTLAWHKYYTRNSGIPGNDIVSISIDKNHDVWVAAKDGGIGVLHEKERNFVTGTSGRKFTPSGYYLFQNYPNPFNPVTEIGYEVPERVKVELKVYNILGSLISTLVNTHQNAGRYSVSLNGSMLPSGIYIYTIQAGKFRESRKLVLLK